MAFPDCDTGAKVSSTSRSKEIRSEAVVVGKEVRLTLALPGAINNPLTKERTGTGSLSRAKVGYLVASLACDSSQ